MRFFVLSALLIACSLGCTEVVDPNSTQKKSFSEVLDQHTYANISEIHTEHLDLDLDVNFDNQTIYGVARHRMSAHKTTKAVFDIKGLEIMKVTVGKTSKEEIPTEYSIGENDELLGAPLTVLVKPNTEFVNIYYKTTDKAEALDWLTPELTAGKKFPFMYTQGQAILTRSWIPLQDTPMSRITYSADVQVPKDLMAVMSASNPKSVSPDGKYHFEMNQKIPAYLIALAVGNMKYVSLGNKCGVYAEPENAALAKTEFEDVPKMMRAAERLYGEYRWDQYDIVILPYSFPFGGMENPRLTFANPTILAGDKSMVSVIAHELAHSWSGNLVTNATWDDFWLNEGFTVYFENRIMEKLYGKEIADILAVIEYQDLESSLETIENSKHPEDSQLKLHLEGRNPDDGMTDIAYIKGAFFLRTLEHLVGRKKFDEFLKNYFDSNAFQAVTTEDFLAILKRDLLEPNHVNFKPEDWTYKQGIPESCYKITSKRLEEMAEMAEWFNDGHTEMPKKFKKATRGDFITQEWQAFIRALTPEVSVEVLKSLDAQFEFAKNGNPAIQSDWFQLAVKTGYKDVRPEMKSYLCKIGRRWYIESIYQCLMDSKDVSDHQFAKDVFKAAAPGYHFVSKSTIADIVNTKKG